jgi:soluble cytochrome b562
MKAFSVALTFLLVLVVLSSVNAEGQEISWESASGRAKALYPTIVAESESNPKETVLAGGTEYWVVELGKVWVPVENLEGGQVLTTEEQTIKQVYGMHLKARTIESSDDQLKDFLSKSERSLSLALTDTKAVKDYVKGSKNALPHDTLKSKAGTLETKASSLESAIQKSLDSIKDLEKQQENVLYSTTTNESIKNWRQEFSQLVSAFKDASSKAESYGEAQTEFVNAANTVNANFTQEEKDFLQYFSNQLSIPNVPDVFYTMKNDAQDWEDDVLEGALSEEEIGDGVNDLYVYYREVMQQRSLKDVRTSALNKLNALSNAPSIVQSLSECKDKLENSERAALNDLNNSYWQGYDDYYAGMEAEEALDFETAKTSYQEAEDWAARAENNYKKLVGLQCPSNGKPVNGETKTLEEILNEFASSPLGMLAIGLVLVLIVLYFFQGRKGGEQESEEETELSWPGLG